MFEELAFKVSVKRNICYIVSSFQRRLADLIRLDLTCESKNLVVLNRDCFEKEKESKREK